MKSEMTLEQAMEALLKLTCSDGVSYHRMALSVVRAHLTQSAELKANAVTKAFADELHDVFVDCDGEISESAIRNALDRAIANSSGFPIADFEIEGGLLTKEQRESIVRDARAKQTQSAEASEPVAWREWDENNPPPPGEYLVYDPDFTIKRNRIWTLFLADGWSSPGKLSNKKGRLYWFRDRGGQADRAPMYYASVPQFSAAPKSGGG